MRLSTLRPTITPEPSADGTQSLRFLCPKCQGHELLIEIWGGPASEIDRRYGEHTGKVRVWHADQGPHRDWDTLSVTPSINREGLGDKCGGWHGFITNGEAK